MKSVTATAPASVANVGCGFDIMGFALSGEGDKVMVEYCEDDSDISQIRMSGKYSSLLPSGRELNTAGVAVDSFLNATGNSSARIRISLVKNLPLGSGMGSSASSSAAAVFAVNRLLGEPLATSGLVRFAMEGERVACGTAHADNVAPSLIGGFVLIRSNDPLDIIRIKCPGDLFCTVIHPHIEVRTSDARRILKREIPLGDVTKQTANSAAFMTGILLADYDLISRSMHDLLAEPKRTMLIPGFEKARKAAVDSGALGCGISGSGPSVFALCRGAAMASLISEAMQASFLEAGLTSDTIISTLNEEGARIVED